ncbi:MAG: hypothetical protein GAK31_00909 [Stenotrophomonas maltophilia]|uniref:CopY family transcriptional regulator n=1 Tax=Stenotrophomonas maltophilia TaxID=40324 RepID=A0A7V8FKB5_STEMA|nr:MAG: hypothetical protein GAK31_00909 [Stenotrophomonas maltophilia]
MSAPSLLLRIVLMLSLLLNGLNAALASGHEDMVRHAAPVAALGHAGMADCPHHSGASAEGVADDATPQADASGHDAHAQINDCMRSCAQHPLLAVQPLPFLAAPGPAIAPPVMARDGRPSPPLPPASRPPIG